MYTPRKFSLLVLSITLSIILLIGISNFFIDGDSARHLPDQASAIPRSTNHSALSKLHYLYERRPEVVYFGSSRVEVGLPIEHGIFPNMSVYNAGLSANSLGNTIPLMMHVLSGYSPKTIVLGIDFWSFTDKPSPLSNLDMDLLSSSFSSYRYKRLWYDAKRAVTVEATQNSFSALRALYTHMPYDPIDGAASIGGQTSENEMLRLTATRGQYLRAFQRTLQYANGQAPAPEEVSRGLKILENFVFEACTRKIQVRIFTNPRHALAEYMLAKNGHWPEVENWKIALANIQSRYQDNCDIKIFDFSGFNSVTSEPIHNITPQKGLKSYWEASHFKGKVGSLILQRMFSGKSFPYADFGRELNNTTVAEINAVNDREREDYVKAHASELPLANAWLKVDTSQ